MERDLGGSLQAGEIVLPESEMGEAQRQTWHGLLDVCASGMDSWCLVGGQMTRALLWRAGFGGRAVTDDGDVLLDVRARPTIIEDFTQLLHDLGFEPSVASPSGLQYRWSRDLAQIDILLPDGIGERSATRRGVAGGLMTSTPGGTYALNRVQRVEVVLGERRQVLPIPSLAGALLIKSAAYTKVLNDSRSKERHLLDFAWLLQDFEGPLRLSRKERQLLVAMLAQMERSEIWHGVEGVQAGQDRLVAALG